MEVITARVNACCSLNEFIKPQQYAENKKASNRKQIARQHSYHNNVWPGQGA